MREPDNDIIEDMKRDEWIRSTRCRLRPRDPYYPPEYYRQDHEAEFQALAEVENAQRYPVW